MLTTYVFVRALTVRKSQDGLYELQLPARELTETELAVLQDLFPHLAEQVHELLTKETILDAISPRPVETQPKKKNGKPKTDYDPSATETPEY